MSKIIVTLSSANMGDVDEIDFDCWTGYVIDCIDDGLGFEVAQVEQARYGGTDEDVIENATEEQRAAIVEWLSVTGWNEFCGQEWEDRRAATVKSRAAA